MFSAELMLQSLEAVKNQAKADGKTIDKSRITSKI